MPLRRIRATLSRLSALLDRAGHKTWSGRLRDLSARLSDPRDRDGPLQELKQLFGGADSLNGVLFLEADGTLPEGMTERQANERFGRLMDTLYRELSLLGLPFSRRIRWRWHEWRHRADLPLRFPRFEPR